MNELFVNIAINIPLHKLFTYKVQEPYYNEVEIGKRVLVPFGNKIVTGIIVEILNQTDLKTVRNIKSIIDEENIIPDEMISLCKWISEYYIAPIGEVFFSIIPRHLNVESNTYYSLNEKYKFYIDKLKGESEFIFSIVDLFSNNIKLNLTKKQIDKIVHRTHKKLIKLAEVSTYFRNGIELWR